jgi:hypothetical protein
MDFTTLYFNDNLLKYEKYIKAGGILISDDEGDFTNELKVFTKENFIQYFKNLWLNYFPSK